MQPQETTKSQQLIRVLLISLGSVVALVTAGLFGMKFIAQQSGIVSPSPISETEFVTAQINTSNGQATFSLEIADSQEEWRNGLMGRTRLPENTGMIFIFPNSQYRSFWMKNTLIPLDIIYADQDMHIIDIHTNTKVNQTTETYPSTAPAKYVIEFTAGTVERYSIKVGDSFQLLDR